MAIEISNKILAFAHYDVSGNGRSAGCTVTDTGGGTFEIELERDVFDDVSPGLSNVLWTATRTDGPGFATFAPTTKRKGTLSIQALAPFQVLTGATVGTAIASVSAPRAGFVQTATLGAGSTDLVSVVSSASLSAGTSSPAVTSVDFVGQTTTAQNFLDTTTPAALSTAAASVVENVNFPLFSTTTEDAVLEVSTTDTNVLTGIESAFAAGLPEAEKGGFSIVFFQFPGT